MDYESKERVFFENWMTEHEYEYDNIPIEELMQVYADKINEKLIEALEEISEGKGSYDEDKLKHCSNTVRDMIELANKALGRTTKN